MPSLPPLPPEELDEVVRGVVNWEPLRGARLFITGGTGFFGMWLLESLARADQSLGLGVRATILTRDARSVLSRAPHLEEAPFEWLEGDVRSFAFPRGAFTHAIHGAASAQAIHYADHPREMLDTILEGTRRVLEFAATAGVRRLLLLSSGAVYGTQPAYLAQVPETYPGAPDPLDPGSVYGHGKRLAEHLSALFQKESGLEIPVARCFAFVGPHLPLDSHFAIGNFIRDGLSGGPIRVSGDGTPCRSYLYGTDLAVWLWTLLLRGLGGRAYNVGSDEARSILELAWLVARQCGSEVVVAGKSVPGAPAQRYVPEVRRAVSELGLRRSVELPQAIERTLQWHRKLRS